MSASLDVCKTVDKAPMSEDLIMDNKTCDLNGNIVQTSQPPSPMQDELAKLKAKIAEQNAPKDAGDVKASESLNKKEKCSSIDRNFATNQESGEEKLAKLQTQKPAAKFANVSNSDEDVLVEEKLDATDNEVALSIEDEEKEPNDGGISAAVSSGIEGTSDVSDTPLTDTTNKDDNEANGNTKDTSPSKKKKLRVKVAPSGRSFNSGGQRYRNRNSATTERRDDNYSGQRYNNRQQPPDGSTVPGALGGFIRSFQRNQNNGSLRQPAVNGNGGRFYKDAQVNTNYGPRGPRNGFHGNIGFQAPRPRFGSFRTPGFANGGMGNRYNGNNSGGSFHNGYQNDSFFKPNAPFPVPGTSVYSRLGSVGNGYEKETDRFDELIKTIDYYDNGNVINIKASLGQSALNKLKEQKSYNLRVRLPATTPLSVVKRVLCAKFYLTKMMTVAKYSTDRNAEFYQDGGSMFMENRSRKIDLMSQLPIEEIQLRCLNNPNLFLSESETLHTMLQRHHYLQRATPQGGEVMFVLR